MYRILLSVCVVFFSSFALSQAPNTYLVSFKNKNLSEYDTLKPEEFLSPKAIEKRNRHQISITTEDIPITQSYIDLITLFDTSAVKLITKSKWMNYIVITCNSESLLKVIDFLPFVDQVCPIHLVDYQKFNTTSSQSIHPYSSLSAPIDTEPDTTGLSYYGEASKQIAIHNGHFLHKKGYRGEEMLIVLLDNGYYGVDNLTSFSSFRENNRLLGTWDAAQMNEYNIFKGGSHGMKVLSTMAIDNPYSFVGTAPNADYFLIRTEIDDYEDILEEYFWVAGAEFADSIGADVLNSSLGYTEFDNQAQNHTFLSLDGKNSVASIAATKLAQKGCIVSISAGNQGDKPWHYTSIPADAEDILCVAAVNTDSLVSDFSSRGSTSFLQIKPDVASVGWGTVFCNTDDLFTTGNGTSFASPVNAGLCACLWQAFPEKTSLEIMHAIRASGHLHHQPDTILGYGIPDYKRAYNLLLSSEITSYQQENNVVVSPNPAADNFTLKINSERLIPCTMQIFDVYGKIMKTKRITDSETQIDISSFSQGMYFLRISKDSMIETLKFIRK